MTNIRLAAGPRSPAGRTGYSELGLELGRLFITNCPPALFCPAGLLLHYGSTEDMFEQLTQGHESRYSNSRKGVGISKALHQTSKENTCDLCTEEVFTTAGLSPLLLGYCPF